jgi:DCN1-like protein 4/5
LALFQNYADSDDPNVIGPEGFEGLCMDSGIPLEGALPLILAWQVDAKEMAKISKEEWAKGMDTLKYATRLSPDD